jgi:ClpP class serine protease
VAKKDPNEVDDKTLILADVGRKAQQQVEAFAGKLLLARLMPPEKAQETARLLSEGRRTHDFPIDAEYAQALGLPVSTELPDEVRLLMRLYPQPRGADRPSSTSPPLRTTATVPIGKAGLGLEHLTRMPKSLRPSGQSQPFWRKSR